MQFKRKTIEIGILTCYVCLKVPLSDLSHSRNVSNKCFSIFQSDVNTILPWPRFTFSDPLEFHQSSAPSIHTLLRRSSCRPTFLIITPGIPFYAITLRYSDAILRPNHVISFHNFRAARYFVPHFMILAKNTTPGFSWLTQYIQSQIL